jgi:hypothetical protein
MLNFIKQDGHAMTGILGLATFAGCMATYNEIMGAIAATFTAGYMGIRFFMKLREYRKKKSPIDKN